MSVYKPMHHPQFTTRSSPSSASALGWLSCGIALGVLGVVIAAIVPGPLILPALSVLMVVTGLSLGAGFYLAGYRLGRDPIRGWDIAGAVTFVGFAAALLTDVGQALEVLERLQAQPR